VTVFNVAGLLREPPGGVREHRLRDHYLTLGPDVELAGPIDGEIRMQRTNRGLLVRGHLQAPLRRTCARCLEPFVEEVEVQVIEEFVPSVDPESGVQLAVPDESEATLPISERHEVDLTEVLHDELLLTEPMTPLCQPACPGLCSVCGRRVEGGDHDHGDEEVDPRLAVLAALLEERPEEGDE
jgi:uncharacterized protein